MLASRLLSITLLLQTRGRLSATALAEHFEVSVRTIHRDIDQLSAAGIPVFAERGCNGGFELLEGFRTKLTGLTQAEAETLFLAGLPGPAAELGLAEVMDMARMKLLAALPPGMQAENLAKRFHLDPTGWFQSSETTAHLPIIARAVWTERILQIGYRRGGSIHERTIAPFGLVLKGGVWYLVAKSKTRLLTYRVGNMAHAKVLDEPFARPESFDLAEHWMASARDYELGAYPQVATVRLSPQGMKLLELFTPHVQQATLTTAEPPDGAGWTRCQMPLESLEVGVCDLMRLGGDVEVVKPIEMRLALREKLAAMMALYADTAPLEDASSECIALRAQFS